MKLPGTKGNILWSQGEKPHFELKHLQSWRKDECKIPVNALGGKKSAAKGEFRGENELKLVKEPKGAPPALTSGAAECLPGT